MAETPDAEAPSGPIRTCVGCRRRRPRAELLRVVLTEEEQLRVGPTLPGRGAWVCRSSPTCWEEASRRGGFRRAFRRTIGAEALTALREELDHTTTPHPIDFVPGDPAARD